MRTTIANNYENVSMPELSPEVESLLTVREVAALLRVPVSWIYDHTRPACHNPIPHVKLGKYLRFSPAEISEFLASLRRLGRKRH